jgi:hypothetical protein
MRQDQFVDRQIGAFTDAVRRIDVSRSFLSLTAGLDTRTVFMALAEERRLIPAATMTGVRPSIDARTASRLCAAYGVPHASVVIGDEFRRNLQRYVQRSSVLSGGLASLRQAAEVWFYDQLGGRFAARLSGNLGNQVGRGGTEGVGTRRAAIDVLSPALREHASDKQENWLLGKLEPGGSRPFVFIILQEASFAHAGNYAIGSHFAIQQSPYADRALIETLSFRPVDGSVSTSLIAMRLRDLKHRFVGEPRAISFQRSFLSRLGGFAATYPINYGWRATGGISIRGCLLGAATLAGMVAERCRLDDGFAGDAVERIGLTDLHNFQKSARWLRRDLREFTCDTLSSRRVRDSGIFDTDVLALVLEEHFGRRKNHHDSVTFALDVALAHQFFCS